jgi:hypothetical protein
MDRIILFLNLKKNVKSLKIFLATSIPIKQFNILETCQLSLFPNSSFELNRVEAYPKWIIQFNEFKNNLDDR